MRTVTLEWLFERVIPEPNSGCWLWVGSLNSGGYAQTMVNRRRPVVHRVAYELKYGPVPGDLEMDHLCRVRCCINPDHVEPVTTSVNQLRGIGPAMLAERNRLPEARAITAERNRSPEMRAVTAERNKSPEMRAVSSRPKSPEHAAKLRAQLIARNQSSEMRAIVSRPKSPEHLAAISAALLARKNKQ